MDATADYSEVRFSTDAVPASERLDLLHDALGRSIATLELSSIDDLPLKCAGRLHVLDGLRVIAGEASGMHAHRPRSLLADGNNDLVFHTNRTGFSVVSQAGRECRVDGGAAVTVMTGEPGTHYFLKGGHWVTLCIPRERLSDLVGMPEDTVACPIPSSAEPLRLLLDYIDIGFRQNRLAAPQLRQVFATHVFDLVALAIGATRDAAEIARGRGLGAARLNAAKGEIARHLENGGLTVSDVAVRLGVTPRYLQKLFESEGTTFTGYVARQRLVRAYRILSDPRFLDRSITTIAFDVGFANLSHFNRLFRRNYGATPSEVRAGVRPTSRERV